MDVFESLESEHGVIHRALGALEAYLDRLEAGDAVDRADLARFAQFFDDFADERHHQKEEDLLFPTLVKHGFWWDRDPLALIRREHEQERYLMEVLRQAGAQTGEWQPQDRSHVLSIGRTFVDFLRKHAASESQHLFPEAKAKLPKEVLDDLRARNEEFDVSFGGDRREGLLKLCDELVRRYPAGRDENGSAPGRP